MAPQRCMMPTSDSSLQEIIATVVHLISSGQVRLGDEAIEAIKHLVATMDEAA